MRDANTNGRIVDVSNGTHCNFLKWYCYATFSDFFLRKDVLNDVVKSQDTNNKSLSAAAAGDHSRCTKAMNE